MKLITWNIQWGRGIDGRVDLARIVRTARSMADFDVFCAQEIADNFPALEGNDDRDQFAALGDLLPGFTRVQGYGVDVPGDGGRRRRFGNAIFSRLPVSSVRRHALPWPADPAKCTMPRVAVEAVLAAPWGALRVTTTHLEYFSEVQRRAQARRLAEIHAEACGRAAAVPPGRGDSNATFAPAPQATDALLVGDFNFPPEHPAFGDIQRAIEGAPAYRDAWGVLRPGQPHAPTFCVHSDKYAKSPYCCDFVFASESLLPRLRAIAVDSATRDSDHQPVLVEMAD
jgi:endonuclease/exonuclease/phosphatase family metal-dependent hydrolase